MTPATTTLSPSLAPPATLSLAALAAVTRDLADRPDLWRRLVRFDRGERWWTRLEGPPGTDVWLLSWLRSQGTELHDHGESGAAFTVVVGTLTETRPDPQGRLVPLKLRVGQAQTVEPGAIHDVVNDHAEPAVSIHAYSPRLERMTYYTRAAGRITATHTVLTHEPEQEPGR